jgi:phosphate transport system permease protein
MFEGRPRISLYRKIKHHAFMGILTLCTVLCLIPLFWIMGYLIYKGLPGLNLDLFLKAPLPVGETGGGLAHAFVGSILVVGLASLVSIPWGVGIGVYLSEYGKTKFAETVRFATQILASIPSILVGLFIYGLLVRPFKQFSACSGAVALSILMIPTIAKTTEEILKTVPVYIREGGLALGLPRWKVVIRIVLRGSIGSIFTGIMLAIARASGETAPLLFTALGSQNFSLALNQPIATIPVQIYTYAITPYPEWHQKAWSAALILVLFVFLVNLTTRWLIKRST